MSQSSRTRPPRQSLRSWWNPFLAAQKASPKENVSLARTVFGVPLQESLRYASVEISAASSNGELYVWGYVPVVIAKCGLFLKENATEVKGIFRIFGSNGNIRTLQAVFETPPRYGKDLDFKHEHYTPYDIASVFRQYIILLPEPIIPIELYHQFRGALAVEPRDEANVINLYQRLFKHMPRANQYLLLYILDIVSVFARKSDTNLATESSLASILHPGIISYPSPSREMQLEAHAINQEIFVFLIQHQDHFMAEPPKRYDHILLNDWTGPSKRMEYTVSSDEESFEGESNPVGRGRALDNLDLRDQAIEGQNPLVAGSSNTRSMKPDVDPPEVLPDTDSGHPIVISHYMPTSEVVAHLGNHGCRDLTEQLDLSSGSTFPVSNGGFGDVWKARMQDSTHIAIKTMRPQINTTDTGKKQLKHVARELHTWAKCDHPNVLKLLGLAMFRDQLGMVSLWMHNGSLPEYLSRKPESDRCKICIQMCEGLVYLHQNDIIHGDLKGLNVLVSDDGSPVLTDFGNARMRDRSLLFTTTTAHSSISTRWTAPELLDGPSVHSMEADIYALGMTILEALTGRVPYSDKGDAAVMFTVMIKKEHPRRPEDVIPNDSKDGDTLWSLLLSCWIHDPTSRPTAHQVAKVMETITSRGLISIRKTRVNLGQKLNR